MQRVSFVKLSSREEREITSAISRAARLVNFKTEKKPEKIVIKPNLCYYWDYSTGCTTDPIVVRSLIDWIRSEISDEGEICIAEADAAAMRTKYAFEILGYADIAKEKDVKLVNLSTDQKRRISVNNMGKKFSEFDIPQTLEQADLLINVPKLKVWEPTKISCALKNIYGANPFVKKVIYHSSLDEVISDLNTIIRPKLTLVDGIIALPNLYEPFRLRVLAASLNSVAVDCAVARVLGLNPRRIKHISLSVKKGVGTWDYTVVGENIESISKLFPLKSRTQKMSENLTLWKRRALLWMYQRVVSKRR